MVEEQGKKKRPSALGLENHLPIEGPGRDDLMQLYAWNFEDAWAAQEEWENRYGPHAMGRGPFFRWVGAQELKEVFEIHKQGNKNAITEGLFVCTFYSLPMPKWLEMAYLGAYRAIRHYKKKSWDDVFGRPHPKGMHLETKRQESEKPFLVYKRIEQIKNEDPATAIDGALFERVGKEIGIGGKTLTESYYYKELKFHKPHQCSRCGKRFKWYEMTKDGFCNSCKTKMRDPKK